MGASCHFPLPVPASPPLTDLMRIQAEKRSLQTAGSIMPLNSPRHTSPLEAQFALAGKAQDAQETSEFSAKERACLSVVLSGVKTLQPLLRSAPRQGLLGTMAARLGPLPRAAGTIHSPAMLVRCWSLTTAVSSLLCGHSDPVHSDTEARATEAGGCLFSLILS